MPALCMHRRALQVQLFFLPAQLQMCIHPLRAWQLAESDAGILGFPADVVRVATLM